MDSSRNEKARADSGQPPAKRPYDTPRLKVYGDLRLRTSTRSTGSTSDGGSHPLNMTG